MWHAYRLVYRLESPLHVGWRKVGNLMQTRPYVPGRAWWGAATSQLTQWLGSYSYPAVGNLVRENLIFGYFFPAFDPAAPLIPRWTEQGELLFGSKSAEEFERQFLSSMASTAITYQHNTAAEGQLHEVEFIAPQIDGDNIYLVGHLLAKESSRVECKSAEVNVDGLSLFGQVLTQASIGGERRYGFGKVRIEEARIKPSDNIFGHSLEKLDQEKPQLRVKAGEPLPSHCLIDGLDARGEIEPLLGREWKEETGPGRHLSSANICWVPGSVAQRLCLAEVRHMGILGVVQ